MRPRRDRASRRASTRARMQAREVFALPPLRCELSQVRDVLSALLHTIVFARALGCCAPRDARCERVDVHYVACGDGAVDGKIEEKINALVRWALKTGGGEADVAVSFYERERDKPRRGGALREALSGGRTRREEARAANGYWEQWRIGLEIFRGEELDETERARAREALRDQVVGTQRHVLGLVNEMKAHVPPVTTSDVVSFPFEISVPLARDDSPGSFGRDMLKRLASLGATPPSMI